MDVSIGQAYRREACYLYGKTGYFVHKCPNQKAQIRAVLHAMTSKKRQVQADKMRKLDESSAEEEQSTEEAPLEEDFMEAQA